ncbi:nucleotidyltransferase family protein [candidate division KSB1 bacterium]|nr:nucleotidyltransferase family protein [candidate division KSB1 bacterium]
MPTQYLSVLGLEERILLCCARLDPNAQSCAALEELLQGRVDWEGLLQRSIKQSMTPLLYRHLRSEATLWRRVPEVMRMQLQQIYHRNIQRNELLLAELDQLFATFNAADVPVMLMKELHLLHTIYPEAGLRPLGDLDLLVPPHDFERAKAMLKQAGYHPQLPANPFKDKYGFGYHFVNHAKGIWIDLQWNLSQRDWAQSTSGVHEFRAPIKEVWQRAHPDRLLQSRVARMSWEDLLFHLCVHLEGHGFNEMIQFCDMAEVLRQYGAAMDWRTFINITRAAQMQGSVSCALEFVQQVLGVSAPAEVLAELRPDFLKFGLYSACFGTLGRLHTFLDEAASDSCVPAPALKQWEATVRETAALNRQSYAALTGVTQALANEGFRPVVLVTRSPEQLLPHPALARMGETEILVPDKHAASDAKKNLPNASALPPPLLSQWWSAPAKYASRQLLKKILQSSQPEPARPIAIHMLAPEDVLLVLCLRFSRTSAPWQTLSMVAEFLRNLAGDLNWQKFQQRAQSFAALREVALALKSVAQLTSVEIPSAAFKGLEECCVDGGLDLFPLPAPQQDSEAQVKQAIQKFLRAALLPTWKGRRDYLMNLAGANSVFSKIWKPALAAIRFGFTLLRNKIRRSAPRPVPQEKLQAYWLEIPQMSASSNVVIEPRRARTVERESLRPVLAVS